MTEEPQIVVVGDLQRTSLLEFWRRQHDRERRRILARVAEVRPDLLILLGDLVFQGSSARHWARFDDVFAPVRDAGIETWPLFGNHEYRGGGDGVRSLLERFPHLGSRRWHSLRAGPLAIVLLDDNVDRLGASAFAEEMEWYGAELARLDADPDVRHVLVATHHPAWTNVWVLPESRVVNEHVVPPFLAAEKTVALLCGHVHAYERFTREGKALIVAGGGGAPRMRLRRGRWRRHPDLCDAGPLRDFHLLRVTPGEERVAVVVESLAPGAEAFGVLDRFELPLSVRGETRR